MTTPPWQDPAGWHYATGTTSAIPYGTVTWPTMEVAATAPRRPAPSYGWKCADCGQVMAPWVPSHDCDPPGFLAKDAACCEDERSSCSRCAGRETGGPGDPA